MNITTLSLLALCYLTVSSLPKSYVAATQELYRARLAVAAAREPCPQLPASQLCRWRVQARAQGIWKYCQDGRLPSGADLPSHRYFKIIPNCQFTFGIPLLLPPQVVYR